MKTRSSEEMCHCFLCQKGRDTLKPQAPSTVQSVVKVCLDCQTQLSPGIPHQCNNSRKKENLVDLLKSLDEKSKLQVISKVLKGKSTNLVNIGII